MAELVSDLRDALRSGDLRPFYQPQIDLLTGAVVGVEVLARWTHATRGVVTPGEFVPVAERYGLMRDLGRSMLEAACRQLQVWWRRGHRIDLAVNASPTELTDTDFCVATLGTLDRYDIPVTALTMELTETQPLSEDAASTATLQSVEEAGVRISVDDYGAGFWVIRQFHAMHATELKLDRLLVHAGFEKWVADVVREAQDAGARVVAEGVETDAHLQTARELGCDRAQGYLLGAPVSAAEMTLLLDGRAAASDVDVD